MCGFHTIVNEVTRKLCKKIVISNYEDITYFLHSTKTMKRARNLNLGSPGDSRDIKEWGQAVITKDREDAMRGLICRGHSTVPLQAIYIKKFVFKSKSCL